MSIASTIERVFHTFLLSFTLHSNQALSHYYNIMILSYVYVCLVFVAHQTNPLTHPQSLQYNGSLPSPPPGRIESFVLVHIFFVLFGYATPFVSYIKARFIKSYFFKLVLLISVVLRVCVFNICCASNRSAHSLTRT